MIFLFLLILLLIVALFYLIFKTGLFFFDGFTNLINRIISLVPSDKVPEFSDSEIAFMIFLPLVFLIGLKILLNINNKYKRR